MIALRTWVVKRVIYARVETFTEEIASCGILPSSLTQLQAGIQCSLVPQAVFLNRLVLVVAVAVEFHRNRILIYTLFVN